VIVPALEDDHSAATTALEDLRRQLPAIFDSVAEGITVLDRSGTVVLANEAAAKLLGLADAASAIGQPSASITSTFELMGEDGSPLPLEQLPSRRAFAGEEAPEQVVRFRARGGMGDKWSLVRARLLAGPTPDEDLVVTSFRDVTALKQVELRLSFLAEASAALGESLDYHETLSRVAGLVVPVLADWCAIDVVEDLEQVHRVVLTHSDPARLRVAEEIQRRWPDPVNPGPARRVMADGTPFHVPEITDEMLVENSVDADHLDLLRQLELREVLTVPLEGRGRVLGALTVGIGAGGAPFAAEDVALIEELGRRAGSAIEAAKLMTEAQEAVRQRDEFLAIASHDMRTPLAAVRGYAQLALRHLSREAVDTEPLRRWLEDIDHSAERLTHLVGELMDVSLLRGGQTVPLQLQPTDLVKLVNERVREHANAADEAHTFSVQAEAENVIGHWDTARLGRVLDNLLGNAVKYSPDGGPIEVMVGADGAYGVVAVTDHGIGIAAKEMARIFTPMFRGTNTGSVAGTGLGLSGSRTLVELMGGRIQVQSRLGEGSTFTIWLPLQQEPGEATPPDAE
jgi:PAS domain S-box-containing protein